MTIYCISGIGGDYRLFRHIRLPEDYKLVHLDWIAPLSNETLPAYATRLGSRIDRGCTFFLLGVSLGGIIAVEIAKQVRPAGTIIVSSIPLSQQLPSYYRMAGKIGLPTMVPARFIKGAALLKRAFSRESPADKQLLKQMIREGDDAFIRWGLGAVLEWDNTVVPQPFWHIHGSRDEVFPLSKVRPTHIIRKGGHLLLMSHAGEINRILLDILQKAGSQSGY